MAKEVKEVKDPKHSRTQMCKESAVFSKVCTSVALILNHACALHHARLCTIRHQQTQPETLSSHLRLLHVVKCRVLLYAGVLLLQKNSFIIKKIKTVFSHHSSLTQHQISIFSK